MSKPLLTIISVAIISIALLSNLSACSTMTIDDMQRHYESEKERCSNVTQVNAPIAERDPETGEEIFKPISPSAWRGCPY